MFSERTRWYPHPNRLTEILDARRASGKPIIDLTLSNPTTCGFQYPQYEILSALTNIETLQYYPDPRGLLNAREALVQYYRHQHVTLDPSEISLTSGTSEGYSHVFKLLCNHGDSVLVPKPSYPLFEFLAQINDVNLHYYHLRYDGGWHIDIESLRSAVTTEIKAIALVHPHNPTGMFLKQQDFETIKEIARQYNLALIVDEVFIEYAFGNNQSIAATTAGESDVLTFTLNGISKMCALPQMKLGWIAVSGNNKVKKEALERLEILSDTFLSVNTPVQAALPQLLTIGENIRQQILQRTTSNYTFVSSSISHNSPLSCLLAEGGWYAILKVPNIKSDEKWAIKLLEERGIFVHPGYFFDMEDGVYLIVSLLTEEAVFQKAIRDTVDFIQLQL